MLSADPLPTARQGLELRQIGPRDRDALSDPFERMTPRSRQRRGVGTSLMRMRIMRAHSNGLARLTATTTWENHPARSLLARIGFHGSGTNGNVLEMARELRS